MLLVGECVGVSLLDTEGDGVRDSLLVTDADRDALLVTEELGILDSERVSEIVLLTDRVADEDAPGVKLVEGEGSRLCERVGLAEREEEGVALLLLEADLVTLVVLETERVAEIEEVTIEETVAVTARLLVTEGVTTPLTVTLAVPVGTALTLELMEGLEVSMGVIVGEGVGQIARSTNLTPGCQPRGRDGTVKVAFVYKATPRVSRRFEIIPA
jgi:hypothetical protein